MLALQDACLEHIMCFVLCGMVFLNMFMFVCVVLVIVVLFTCLWPISRTCYFARLVRSRVSHIFICVDFLQPISSTESCCSISSDPFPEHNSLLELLVSIC